MSLNYPALLLALGMLESGNDDMAVGKAGERGRYQIKQEVWEASTAIPFRKANEIMWSGMMAARILDERLCVFWHTCHKDPTPQQVYILWNAPSQVNKPSRKVRERAERFANLYEKYCKENP